MGLGEGEVLGDATIIYASVKNVLTFLNLLITNSDLFLP